MPASNDTPAGRSRIPTSKSSPLSAKNKPFSLQPTRPSANILSYLQGKGCNYRRKAKCCRQ